VICETKFRSDLDGFEIKLPDGIDERVIKLTCGPDDYS